MIGLFLDDERNPEDVTWVDYPDNIEWEVVRNLDSFVNKVEHHIPKYFSFDHDIACVNMDGEELTGYDAIKILVDLLSQDERISLPEVFVHSKNPIGKKNIECYWNNYLKFRGEGK